MAFNIKNRTDNLNELFLNNSTKGNFLWHDYYNIEKYLIQEKINVNFAKYNYKKETVVNVTKCQKTQTKYW